MKGSKLHQGFVIDTVAKVFGYEPSDLIGRSRLADVSEARQTVMFILWNLEGYTLAEIGQALDCRSPATVSYGYQQTAWRLLNDTTLRKTIESITGIVRG